MEKKLTTGEIIIVASGLVMFLFSFFAYFGEDSFKQTAWDEFPLFTYAAIFGLISAVVTLMKLGNVELPAQVLGFTWPQLHLILGIYALLSSVGLFIAGDDAKAGLIFALLGSVGLVVGAVMLRQESASPGNNNSTPF